MKYSILSSFLALTLAAAAPAELEKRSTVQGFDISHYQGTVNFAGAYSSGARFVIIKASFQISTKSPFKAPQSHKPSYHTTNSFHFHFIGNRKHRLPRPQLLLALRRRHLRRLHPRWLPLRPPRRQHRRSPSKLLCRQRRWLVR